MLYLSVTSLPSQFCMHQIQMGFDGCCFVSKFNVPFLALLVFWVRANLFGVMSVTCSGMSGVFSIACCGLRFPQIFGDTCIVVMGVTFDINAICNEVVIKPFHTQYLMMLRGNIILLVDSLKSQHLVCSLTQTDDVREPGIFMPTVACISQDTNVIHTGPMSLLCCNLFCDCIFHGPRGGKLLNQLTVARWASSRRASSRS